MKHRQTKGAATDRLDLRTRKPALYSTGSVVKIVRVGRVRPRRRDDYHPTAATRCGLVCHLASGYGAPITDHNGARFTRPTRALSYSDPHDKRPTANLMALLSAADNIERLSKKSRCLGLNCLPKDSARVGWGEERTPTYQAIIALSIRASGLLRRQICAKYPNQSGIHKEPRCFLFDFLLWK